MIIRLLRVQLVEVLVVRSSTFTDKQLQSKLEAELLQQPTISFRSIGHYVLLSAYRMESQLGVGRFSVSGN